MRRRLLDHTYKKTVTGNPAIAKSVARRNPDISFPGKTEQASYEGKNLFDISAFKSNEQAINNNDGSITLTSYVPIRINIAREVMPTVKSGDVIYVYAKNLKLIRFDAVYDVNKPIKITDEILNRDFGFYGSNDGEITISDIIFSKEKKASYEPYTGGKTSPSPEYPQDIVNAQSPVQVEISDGGDNIQTVTITSDRPITQWDKLTKKGNVWGWLYQTAYIESYNGEEITGEWQSTTGELSTGTSVQYKNSPEFVPLSDEEQQLMNALHTNNPTTVVQNSIGTDVTLTYKTKRSLEVTQ